MSDPVVSAVIPKKKRTSGAKKAAPKAASHPPFLNMITAAIKNLKEKGGSSRSHILHYIIAHYKVGTDPTKVNSRIRLAIRKGLSSGVLLAPKGPSGRFKLSDSKKAKSAGSPKVKKPRRKSKTPKKAKAAAAPAAEGATATPKAAKAKKPKKAKSPKKAKAAKPKKVAKPKSPKKAKSPAKKAAAKSPAGKRGRPKKA